jgi:O-antigen ligase
MLSVAIFGFLVLISTVFSITPYTSFWGSYNRKDGLITLICWIIFFLILCLNMRTRQQLMRALLVLVLSSGIVAALGVAQYFFPNFITIYSVGNGRIFSTIGNPLPLSGYLTTIIPVTLALLTIQLTGRSKGRNIKKIVALGIILALQVSCLCLAQYSVTILLFIIAPVIFLILIGILLRWRIALGTGSAALLIIIIVAVLMMLPRLFPGSTPVAVSPATQEEPISLNLATLGNRIKHWRNTVEMVITSPEVPFSDDKLISMRQIIGYGPETFVSVYQGFYPQELKSDYTMNSTLIDHPHNQYLYLAATSGILGLLGFLAILACFFLLCYKASRAATAVADKLLIAALAASMLGFCADILFNPPAITTNLVFWFILAAVYVLNNQVRHPIQGGSSVNTSEMGNNSTSLPSTGPRKTRLVYSLSAVAALVIISTGISLTIKPFMADMALLRAMNLQWKDISRALSTYQQAIDLQPGEAVYRGFQGSYIYKIAQYTDEPDIKQNLLADSAAAYEKAQALEPYIAYRCYTLSDLYTYWALNGDPGKWASSYAMYSRASALFPGNAVILDKWALSLVLGDKITEAQEKLDRAIAADPSLGINNLLSGIIISRQGDQSKAYRNIREFIENNPGQLGNLIELSLWFHRYHSYNYIADIINHEPGDNPQSWVSSSLDGINYFFSGNPQQSLAAMGKAMQIAPVNYAGSVLQVSLKLAGLNSEFRTILLDKAPAWKSKLMQSPDKEPLLRQLDKFLYPSQ